MAKFPRRGGTGNSRSYVAVGLCLVLVLFAISSRSSWLKDSTEPDSPHVEGRSLQATNTGSKFSLFSSTAAVETSNDKQGDDVLVMYLYDNRDTVWVDNFKFFVQWGIAANDGCSYIILVNEALYAAKVNKLSFGFTALDTRLRLHIYIMACRRHCQAMAACLQMQSLSKLTQRTVRWD